MILCGHLFKKLREAIAESDRNGEAAVRGANYEVIRSILRGGYNGQVGFFLRDTKKSKVLAWIITEGNDYSVAADKGAGIIRDFVEAFKEYFRN